MSSTELMFSGRVFFYSESDILPSDWEDLRSEMASKGIKIKLRGTMYTKDKAEHERPSAFICHDSRDKDEVARPIALQLSEMMCPVWYDEFSLNVGDNLRESIEKGIKECGKCVVVLTPHFFTNKGWTKTEFDSIFTRQILQQANLVLPVWHGVSASDVYEYSPSLANKVGANWSLGVKEVCVKLYSAINAEPQDERSMS